MNYLAPLFTLEAVPFLACGVCLLAGVWLLVSILEEWPDDPPPPREPSEPRHVTVLR